MTNEIKLWFDQRGTYSDLVYNFGFYEKRKRSDSVLWQKSLHQTENSKKQSDNTKNATINFDYKTIVDRLWTVSWSNDSHPAGVVKPVLSDLNLMSPKR